MDNKKLIQLYLENVEKMFGYVNMEAYIDRRLEIWKKYCQKKTKKESIEIFLTLLGENYGKKTIYLGVYLALEENDMRYLHNALSSAVVWGQLTILSGGVDHSLYAWNILPYLFCANRFHDIKSIFPKANGFSKNGLKSACCIINLVMYLYYQEPVWKQYVTEEGKSFLQAKRTAEEKMVVQGLLALVEKNWESFSLALNHLCKAHRRVKGFGENAFTRAISFFAFGLYSFARYLYKEEISNVMLPKNEFLFEDFRSYQESNDYRIGQPFCVFKEPLLLLNDFERIDLPIMHLSEDKKRILDIEGYQREVIERIQALRNSE